MNKFMKAFLTLLCLFAILSLLVACGGTQGGGGEELPPTPDQPSGEWTPTGATITVATSSQNYAFVPVISECLYLYFVNSRERALGCRKISTAYNTNNKDDP